jgi:hypothetical protein
MYGQTGVDSPRGFGRSLPPRKHWVTPSRGANGTRLARKLASLSLAWSAGVVVCLLAVPASSIAGPASSYAHPTGPKSPGRSLTQSEGQPSDNAMAVLTSQGVSAAQARQSLELQSTIAEARLIRRVEVLLGHNYAGVWFSPSTTKFLIGLAPTANGQAIRHLIAQTGLAAHVSATPVRSTWRTIVAVQSEWNHILAGPIANEEATTGIYAQRNALGIELSSSLPSAVIAALKRRAAAAKVNIAIEVVPPSYLRQEPQAKKTCEEIFHLEQAYCEQAITAGVGITVEGQPAPTCTAGPMLIKGTETYMLTAGHCFGAQTAGENLTVEVSSRFPGGVIDREIGKTGERVWNKERDIAEVKVRKGGLFTEELPDPVPALVAEWVKSPKTPHAVEGKQKAELPAENQVVCHEGMKSGEQCGEVIKLNVTQNKTDHLVETTACGEPGDSGGPYFLRKKPAETEVLMMGTHVSGGPELCFPKPAHPHTSFEPLLDAEAIGFGTLAKFSSQRLLTTANEVRKPRVRGEEGMPLTAKAFTVTSGKSTIETVAGNKIACTADSGEGEASEVSKGKIKLTFTGCEGFTKKCYTSGAAEGEVRLSAEYTLVYTNGAQDEAALLLELGETTIECGTNCPKMTFETVKLRGTGIGPVTPLDKEQIPPATFTTAFSQAAGVQAPTEYENESGINVKVTLEMSGAGSKAFGFEQAGIASTEQLLLKETAEIEG